MSTENSSSNSGIGVFGLLGVVFVTLKLLGITEVATWSWLWVLAPFWIGIAVVVAILTFMCVIALLVTVFEK